MVEIVARRLVPADWSTLRALRLLALRTEPGVFSGSAAAAEAQPPAWWEALTTGTPHQAFGAFAGSDMVGLITAFTWADDPTGGTAFIGMLFVTQGFRGQGIAHRLFEVAMAWLRTQRRFTRAMVGHRASNIASMRAILRQGFVEVRRRRRLWPDGVEDEEVEYVLDLGEIEDRKQEVLF